jgi:hypothetical protein
MRVLAVLFMAALPVGLEAGPVRAQGISMNPHVGIYMPIGVRVDRFDAAGELRLRKRQLTSIVAGARARAMGRLFGVEASLGYAPSWVAVSEEGRTIDIGSDVLLGSIRGVAHVSGEVGPGQWAFELVSGLGMIRRGGSGWDAHDPRLSGGVVAGGAAVLGISGVPLALRLGIEDYISLARNGVDHPRPLGQRVHHNLVWSFGVTLPIGDAQ